MDNGFCWQLLGQGVGGEYSFPQERWAGEEGTSPLFCSQESHGVNTVVRGEEELQSGSGVNADGATDTLLQSKQNKD